MRNSSLTEREVIKEHGLDLDVDEGIRVYCPFCNAKDEKSLRITKTHAGLLYFCFRNSCGKRGIIGGTHLETSRKKPKEFQPKVCQHSMEDVPESVWEQVLKPYGISPIDVETQGFRWLPEQERLYMPIYDFRGYTIGGTAKTIHKGVKPKSIHYIHNQVPFIHYPRTSILVRGLCLVEDVFSAVKVSKVVRSAAILGTHLNDAMIQQFIKTGESYVYLMLDPDATAKAYGHKQRYGSLFKEFNVIPTDRDPKAYELAELSAIFGGQNEPISKIIV